MRIYDLYDLYDIIILQAVNVSAEIIGQLRVKINKNW